MRKRTLVPVLMLLCALGRTAYPQTAATPASASASAPAAPFSGLDAVILVDQSGSMWRLPQNDRYNHRIGQTKNLIYRLAEHVEGTPFVHRLSVINFGDRAEVALSNHQMRYEPADPGAALRLTKAVAERAVTSKDWGNTNIPAALQSALEEYAKMDSAERRLGQERVLLLVTDGRPDVPGTPLTSLQSQIKAHVAALRGQHVGLWVVGLNDASNYWNEGDGAFWEDVAGPGRARLAETASSKISALMQDIVDEWLGTKSSPFKNDEYECPPYLRRIVFSINMALPRSAVGISDPTGNDIPLAAGGSGVSPGTFARFVVEDPAPGMYKLKRDPSRSYTPQVEEFSPVIKRLAPAGAASKEAPTRLIFQVLNSQGRPLEPLPAWPIRPSITINAPDGTSSELKADWLGQGKYTAQWQATQLGTYRVRLKGLVTLKSGAPYDVFGANAASYDERLEITDLHPYWLAFAEPDAADGFRVFRAQTEAPLVFALVNARGERVSDLASLVKDPASWLSLQLLDASGAPLARAQQPLALHGDGTFRTTLPVRLNWWRGQGWWTPGQVYFQLIPQPRRVQGDNYLDSLRLEGEAEELRIGGDPLMVGPLKQRFSRLLLWPLTLLGLGLGLGALGLLACRFVPQVALWAIDRALRRSVLVKVYDAETDPEALYAKKFNVTGGASFNYDRGVNLLLDGDDHTALEFRLRRRLLVRGVEVEVRYRWKQEPKKTWYAQLRKGRVVRFKGLPRGDYALSLEINT